METEETLPFPPPPLLRRGTPTNIARASAAGHELALVSAAPRSAPLSLEQLTEARLSELRNQHFFWETPAPLTAQEHTPAPTSRQIVLASQSTQEASLVPLRWRGMPVSPEFQVYALRVARGEELAPYRGQILADPGQSFPWDEADASSLRSRTRGVVRSLLLLAGCATLAAFVLPSLTSSSAPALAVAAPELRELPAPAASLPVAPVLEPSPAPAPVAPALVSAAAKTPATPVLTPRSAAPRSAATPSVAKSSSLDANKPRTTTAAAAPAGAEPSGPSNLLVERPSF